MSNKKGFTLIELLAVIVILGIILTISIPQVTGYIDSTREKSMRTNAQNFIDAVRTYVTANNEYPPKGATRRYNLDRIINQIGVDSKSLKSPYGADWNLSESEVRMQLTVVNPDPVTGEGEYELAFSIQLVDTKGHCIRSVLEKDLEKAPVELCS